MARIELQPRKSGMLERRDQRLAQELFNHARANDGLLVDEDGISSVVITNTKRNRLSMALFRETNDIGKLTVKFRKGRCYWQDDGSEGYAGFFGDLSKVGPEKFHPTVELRDSVLRQVHDVFVKPKPQSE